jgi:hypothetical protein
MPPERALQLDALEELLDQSHSSELSQADPVGSHSQISRSTAHCCRSAFLMTLYNKAKIAIFEAFGKDFWTSFGRHGAGFRLRLQSACAIA